jgi:hypothetical protein
VNLALLWIKRSLVTVAALTAFVFVANAAIISIAVPGNSQAGDEPILIKTIGDMEILSYEELTSGGIGVFGWNTRASGYVNMLSSEPIIYANAEHAGNFRQSLYLYRHEYAHVLQKEMIAHKSGGYPEVTKPWQSIKYYYNLVKLNEALRDSMPQIDHNTTSWFLTEGFEASADCYAQPRSSIKEDPVYYNSDYLENDHCTAEQVRLAITLINPEEWFNPVLSDEELKEIVKENITTVRPAHIDPKKVF